MDVRRDQLEFFVHLHHKFLYNMRTLIVQDMKVRSQPSVGQQAVEILVRCCEVQACSCLEGFSVNGVRLKLVRDEDILITSA